MPDYGGQLRQLHAEGSQRPDRQASQRARTDDDGPPLLAVDNRLVVPAGKVVKFIITANDVIHSFAMPAFWIKHGRHSRPAQRDLGQGRSAGRLFRPMLRAVRRPPRLHADRRSRSCPQAQFAHGSRQQGGHDAAPRRQPAASPRRCNGRDAAAAPDAHRQRPLRRDSPPHQPAPRPPRIKRREFRS